MLNDECVVGLDRLVVDGPEMRKACYANCGRKKKRKKELIKQQRNVASAGCRRKYMETKSTKKRSDS